MPVDGHIGCHMVLCTDKFMTRPKKAFGKFILWLESCWNQPPTGCLKKTCLPILVVITRPEKLEGLAKTTVCIHKFDVCVCLSFAGKGFGIFWNHTVKWLKSGEPVELGFANSHEKKHRFLYCRWYKRTSQRFCFVFFEGRSSQRNCDASANLFVDSNDCTEVYSL